ncbi:preprotein translocase subunit SecG [Novosphingobium sp. FKTRR1]|uniref:preprotein translocase subunit SecG n=1 Tax=Novosphingobium sp. FKTRR1 TaxID=2879118 RepID=UPI001CEFF4F5|nr:preprotein translocase subunit SecG [Novosphingobium sp. FKTRR1]
MSFFIFLTVVQALVAAALVGVILIQKSEGGGLGVGGNPSGFMSARGAADFLTRATTVLAALFVALSVALAALAVGATGGHKIDTSLNRSLPVQQAPADPLAPAQGVPAPGAAQTNPAAAPAAPAPATSAPADPLGNAAKK